ncbi:RnfABCDGE type electron transport complex subunit D [Nonomuraea sp. SYSU D8015]|uniref:RnfABCDGE type electron transport complex subunit D n=1 Tax=Nonomuraea sp. SYSU D8015 TaxID=2593644 RepID=UPI0016601BA3|nr:RnfABCDGE type electron transport complex subunit D [Nonomuraea sp. SYSU D8015]
MTTTRPQPAEVPGLPQGDVTSAPGATPTAPAAAAAKDVRITALRRFALAITVLNIAGYAILGFEPALICPIAALATAYAMDLGLEYLDARMRRRPPRFLGAGVRGLVDFLLPAHITALAVSMLLYSGGQVWPVVFGVVVALGGKTLLRVRMGRGDRHVMNPSNFGITVTLLCFTWVGIAPPYHFTENVTGLWDWLLPAIIITTGTLLNAKLTKRMPLIAAWVGGFAAQGLVRVALFDAPPASVLLPMTGLAFVLFTNYMITDPATTPVKPLNQVFFGAGAAALYGLLTSLHVAFGMFFALTIVCAVRGLYLFGCSQRGATA